MTTLVLATIALVAAIASAVTGIVVVAFMAGTVVVTYQIWDQFRHDKGGQSQRVSTEPSPVER